MEKAVRNHTAAYPLLHLPLVLAVLAAQLWLLHTVRSYPVPYKVLAVILSIALHVINIPLLWKCWKQHANHISQISPLDVFHYRTHAPQYRQSNLICSWRLFDQARDAYYLDTAWLEHQSILLRTDDPLRRETLLGQSIWLSVICDSPRLALIRLRLLSKGKICDGFDTDLDEIMNQLMPTSGHVERFLQEQPRMLQPLCECVMFDSVGISPANCSSICNALERLSQDSAWFSALSESERSHLLQTIAYCRPVSPADDSKQSRQSDRCPVGIPDQLPGGAAIP